MTMTPGQINLASQADMHDLGTAPHEYFKVLRSDAPVFWNPPPGPDSLGIRTLDTYEPTGFWVLSKYDDVAMASKDAETFSCWENGVLWIDLKQSPEALNGQRSGLMGMDPPQHSQYRRLVQPGFTPRSIAALEPHIREEAAKVIGALADREDAEFVFDVAAQLPMILLCELMGVPEDRRDEYFRYANATANVEFNDQFIEDQINLFVLLDDLVKTQQDAPSDTLL